MRPITEIGSPIRVKVAIIHVCAQTAQCAADAFEAAFLQIQAHAFAKSSPDTRT